MTKLTTQKESGHKNVTTKDLNNILESIQRQTLLKAYYNTDDQNIESSLYSDDENNHSIHTTTRPSQLLSTSSSSSSSSSITKYEYWLNQMGLSPHVIQYLIQSKRNNINDRTTQGLNTLNNQIAADNNTTTTTNNNHLNTTNSSTWPNLRHIFANTHNLSRHSMSTSQSLIGPHTPLYQHDHIANYPHIYTDKDTDIQKDLSVAIHTNILHDDTTTSVDNTNNRHHENNTMGIHKYSNHHEIDKSQLSPYIIDEYISQLKQGQLLYTPYNQYNVHQFHNNIHGNTDMMNNNNSTTDVHNITRNSTASVTAITNQQMTPSLIENDYLHLDPSVYPVPSPYISHTIPSQPYAVHVYESPYRSVPLAIRKILEPYITLILDRYIEPNKVIKSSSSILMLPTCKSRKKRKREEINTQEIQISPSSHSFSYSTSSSSSSSSSSTSIPHNQVNSEDNNTYTAHESKPSLPLPFRRELLLGALGRHSEGLADTLLQWLFDSTEALLKKEGHFTENNITKRYITWKDVLQMLHQTYSHHSINPYVYEVQNSSEDLHNTVKSLNKKRRLFQVHPRLPYMRLNDTIMTRIQNRLRGLFESAEVPALQRIPITHHHTMNTRTVQSTSLDRYTHTLSSPSAEHNINISKEHSVESVLVHPRSQQTRLPTLPRRYSSISKKSSRYFLKKLYKSYQPYAINLNRAQDYQLVGSNVSRDTQKKHVRDICVPVCTSDSGLLDVVNSIKTTPISTNIPRTSSSSSSSMHSLSTSMAIFQPYSKIHIYYKRLPSTTTKKARSIKRIRQKRKKNI